MAYLTSDRERVINGGPLHLYSDNLEDLKQMTVDIAKGVKADVVQITNGDYLVIEIYNEPLNPMALHDMFSFTSSISFISSSKVSFDESARVKFE